MVTKTCKKDFSSKRLFVAWCTSCLWYCSISSESFASEFGCQSSMRIVYCLEFQDHPFRLLEDIRLVEIVAIFLCHIVHHPNTDPFGTRGRVNEGCSLRSIARKELSLKVFSIDHFIVYVWAIIMYYLVSLDLGFFYLLLPDKAHGAIGFSDE